MSNAALVNKVQANQNQRSSRYWLLRILIGAIVATITLTLSSALNEFIARSGDAARFPPPGKLVQVNGHSMHLHCTGEGSITLILEAGANAYSDDWAVAQPRLSTLTRTCSYDRAGFGWSEHSGSDSSLKTVARNLHEMISESQASTANNEQLPATILPGDLPIYVLTAQASLTIDGWEKGQAQLAGLSTNSVWQIVPNSNHSLHATHPDVIVDSVRRVLTAAINGSKLTQGN